MVAIGAVALVAMAWWAKSFVGPGPAGTSAPALSISPLTDSEGLSLSGSWSPDATQLAYDYTLNGSMDIAVMSLGGGEPRLVAGGSNDETMPRWSPDGSRIAFLSDDGTGMNVYWVPPTGGARQKIAQTHLQYLDRFTSIAALGSQPWSPDGRRLVFSRLEATNGVALWTADIESGQEARLTSPPAGTSDWRAAWSHDGNWIVFSRLSTGSPSNLLLVPASGGEPREVHPDKTVYRGAATWSLDDHYLLFVSAGAFGGDVSELEIGTGRIRQLTVGATVSNPILSSKGRVVFSDWSHETFFFRMPVADQAGKHEQISLSGGSNFGQRFSPDGRQIVFQSSRAGRSALWLHDMETGTERQVTFPPAEREDRTPDWSPDGTQVVFLSNRAGPFQLWVADVNGRATHRLSEQAIPMDGDWWVNARVAPRWSSDGRAIAYLAPGERGSTLWLINPDGRNARPTRVSGVLRFDWYLDSRRAIYTRNGADGRIEIIATNLDTGEESLLLKANATELSVAPDGSSVAYNSADGHFSMNRYVLTLVRPTSAKELPHATGAPRQVTFGKGVWHVHGGAWSQDSRWIVYTRDFDRGNLSVIDNYRAGG
jgi:Tol biopolymer transport system component